MYEKIWNQNKIAFGGDYNPEQWDEATWEEDMHLFRLAHIDTVTLNVFSWAMLQPDESTYDFTKLDRIMELVKKNGLKVVLATSTGAHPAWMAHRYPEILRTEFNGMKRKFGGRHNSCPNSPVYRMYSARLAEKLADYMARERLEYELTAFASGEAFSAALEQGQRFNLVFMDIYMDGITGIEAAQALRARDMDCKLVFLTTSEDFMRQGFSLNSAHYLIKPVKDEDFAQAMANCRLGRALQVPTLAVTVEGRTLEVDTRQIRYLEVQQRSVVLHTTRGDLPLGRSFSAAAAPLERDRRFLLCFKGVLVNMDHIAAQTGDELRLDDGSILPIAPRRRREILAQYRAYMFGRMREP